jgi:hypothetical protein
MSYRHLNYRHIAIAAVLAGAASTTAAIAGPRGVVELFTSQGCSSCPAADKLLGELAQDSGLLTMSLPVDYWDYLGWKDTLALHGHSVRQHAYANARGDGQVYTPQVVVNGVVHVLGSDKDAIEKAIALTDTSDKPLELPVSIAVNGDTATITVPAAKDARANGIVWLCPVTGAIRVAIGRGENNGRTVVYHNVVRRWVKLGDWDGKARTFTVKLAELPNDHFALKDVDRLDVLVQSGDVAKPGVMLGAATANLH